MFRTGFYTDINAVIQWYRTEFVNFLLGLINVILTTENIEHTDYAVRND